MAERCSHLRKEAGHGGGGWGRGRGAARAVEWGAGLTRVVGITTTVTVLKNSHPVQIIKTRSIPVEIAR